MTQALWISVILTTGVVSAIAIIGLARVGLAAYTSGSAPGAPEAFTAFASQVLRIATVIAIVGTTLTLVIRGEKLDSAVTGILSGIAGYVLGGTEKTPKLKTSQSQTPSAKNQQ